MAWVSIRPPSRYATPGKRARPARGGGRQHNGGAGGARKRFRRGGIGRIARLGERLAGDGQNAPRSRGSGNVGGGLHRAAHQSHGQFAAQRRARR